MNLYIEGRHIKVTDEWAADITARANELKPSAGVVHLRATLARHDHQNADDTHEAVVVAQMPGHTVTARKSDNSFEEAIRQAFEALKTELERIQERRASHEVRIASPPERGVVTKLFPEEGYGFIVSDDGIEVYFHRNAVHGLEFEKMDGMEVTLNIEPGEKGPQATTVNPVDPLQYYADKGAAA
ncbi:HPF/RaiA family ribosome-associated protein [Nitrospira sp. BLG_2]|uniref:HPF/RaiA family ribosome-associated protein n=1 Tax=Nitrospira sp. BLG_2 TaxID=3397507 RepID=UPI003B99B5DC